MNAEINSSTALSMREDDDIVLFYPNCIEVGLIRITLEVGRVTDLQWRRDNGSCCGKK